MARELASHKFYPGFQQKATLNICDLDQCAVGSALTGVLYPGAPVSPSAKNQHVQIPVPGVRWVKNNFQY